MEIMACADSQTGDDTNPDAVNDILLLAVDDDMSASFPCRLRLRGSAYGRDHVSARPARQLDRRMANRTAAALHQDGLALKPPIRE